MQRLSLPRPRFARMRRQRGGATLQITLILLVIVLVIGAAMARGTFVQTKVASNFYDRQIAFQAAQAALRLGEMAAQNGDAATFRQCTATAAPCPPNPFTDKNAQIVTVSKDDFDPGALAAGQPEYIVEYLGSFQTSPPPSGLSVKSMGTSYGIRETSTSSDYFRITARSSAPGDDRASVTLQAMYRR